MQKGWVVSSDWGLSVYNATEQFLQASGIYKAAFAQALDISSASLALSHLQDSKKNKYIYQRLPYVLRRDNLIAIAHCLRLDIEGIRALKHLAATVLASNTGYWVDPETMVDRPWEAMEYGMIGCEYFGTGHWEKSLPYLQHAWQYYQDRSPDTPSAFHTMLRVGAQILEINSSIGETVGTRNRVKQLIEATRGYRGDDRELGRAVAFAYKASGTALRHAGVHPEYSIQMAVEAGRILKEHGFVDERIGPLRNQSKPYVAWGWRDPYCREARFEAALAKVERSEGLAGGLVPREELVEEWLLTRLTRIECLAGIEYRDDTRRLWDETMELDAVRAVASPHDKKHNMSALYAKWAFAQIAVCFASQELDRMAELAQAFARVPGNRVYGERLQRCERIVRYVAQGDQEALRQLLIK